MEQIEKSTYQGYLWYSDKDQPKVLNNVDSEITLDETKNPFVIEGQLFDGKYIVKKYVLAELPKEDFTEQSLLAHRMKDVKSLNFRQYWREQEDELCDGKKVLQPAELVFVGLKK